MDPRELLECINQVKRGVLARRDFIRLMVTLGLTAPMAAQILMHAGIASAAARPPYKPTRKGGGGVLKLLLWQGPTLLNPHLATGNKDQYGCRVFYESLAEFDQDGELIPILAAEIPSVQRGTVARDGRSVVWKLKRNVTWHDGRPFTADDVEFNRDYAADPAAGCATIGSYSDIRVEKIDEFTVRVVFATPTPFWADPFVAGRGMLIPKHLFDAYRGARSREAPANFKPVGTGAYKFVDFVPSERIRGVINPDYHEANRPFFDAVEVKGGGDAVSAARAVMQTGEYDYAWNLQVEDEILRRMEQAGKGVIDMSLGGDIEHIQLNASDPWTEVDGERSSPKSKHPILSEAAVREALNYLVDRRSIQEHVYGRTGIVTANFLNAPEQFRSKNTKWEFSIDKANGALDAAGWARGADGVRAKGGRKLRLVFQTSTNAPRQKVQAIMKQACQKAGIDLELKAIVAAVYFSSDLGNPDTAFKFVADLQMYSWTQGRPDPSIIMNVWTTWEIASRENKWSGRNTSRWRSDEYDRTYRAAQSELDPVKRAAMFIRLNDMIIESRYAIPFVSRPSVRAVSKGIRASFSAWSGDFFLLQDWYREA
jgi:peptide/nickel transport system substrate-binding protein